MGVFEDEEDLVQKRKRYRTYMNPQQYDNEKFGEGLDDLSNVLREERVKNMGKKKTHIDLPGFNVSSTHTGCALVISGMWLLGLVAHIYGIVIGFMGGVVPGLIGLFMPPVPMIYTLSWLFGNVDLPAKIQQWIS